MRVLVACEESQRVCEAFRKRGHEAYSCDIQECSGGHPEWHFKEDCFEVMNKYHWDLVIAHPPCTHLTNSGARWFSEGKKDIQLQYDARDFFLKFVEYAERTGCMMAIENPVGKMSTYYRKPDQIYNPYDFEGETECKKTCLWLFNLKPLKPTQSLPKEERTHDIFKGGGYGWNTPECAKFRSKTPVGVSKAMAEQWG